MNIPCLEDCKLNDLYEETKKERDSLLNDVAHLRMKITEWHNRLMSDGRLYFNQGITDMMKDMKKEAEE